MDWDAVIAAGLYDPAAPGAADRRALLEFLAAEGCSLDEMVAANARGRLFGLAGDRKVRPGRDEFTLREAAELTGADVDFVVRLWQAYGLPIVDADTKVASRADLDVLPLFVANARLLGEDGALGLARVAGASVARFADAISAALRAALTDLAIDNTGSEAETARAYSRIAELTPAVGNALDVLLRHHLESARRQFEDSDSYDLALLGQIRVAVAFVDVAGFTALSQVATSAELARMLDSFEELASGLVNAVDGRVVKFIGDAVMYVTAKPAAAVEVALRLVDRSEHPVRAGVAYGVLLAQDGDYFGPPVNLAARLVATAEPGQVLVSDEVCKLLPSDYEVQPLPPRELRGIAEPVTPYAVR
ncbi:MAG TPA: adenylate/guanylate cyclase domain-containing protein [Frankiaceae bacterium]|nr:adenylate/guanylate cyclase domain-containing protein [Frankiaceae bacterium]